MKKALLAAIVIGAASVVHGIGNLSVTVTPGALLPLAGADQFAIGAGAGLSIDYRIPAAPLVTIGGGVDYALVPTLMETRLSLVTADIGAGLSLEIIPKLTAGVAARAGYYLALYSGAVGSGPAFGARAWIEYLLHPVFGLGLDAAYRNYWSLQQSRPLTQELAVSVVGTLHLGAGGQSKLDFRDLQFLPVFPVFYSYYDNHPVGRVTIVNGERATISDVRVTLNIKRYMDKPKECVILKELKAGEARTVSLYALFTDNVLGITEGTTVTAEVVAEYRIGDENRSKEHVQSVQIQNRNAMTWDDDRKAASFVTAMDPAVLKYAKGVATIIRDKTTADLDANFCNAVALFESLSLYGLNYVKDPSTPYEQYSKDAAAVDFLQFPSQTLTYRAGDCDDLSILFCALLESTAIETAFITIPGHIFMAFALQGSPSEAVQAFSSQDDVIIDRGRAWVPIETTMISDGFLRAWLEGAREWRANSGGGKTALYPVHEAWNLYRPVGIASSESGIEVPGAATVADAYRSAMARLVEREIGPRVQALRDQIASSGADPRLLNRLGVLYARYGQYDEAEIEFRRIVTFTEDVPALANLGNIAFLRKDMATAQGYYQRALHKEPANPRVLISLARTEYHLEQYAAAREHYEKARQIAPELAQRYDYLAAVSSGQDRGAAVGTSGAALWIDGP